MSGLPAACGRAPTTLIKENVLMKKTALMLCAVALLLALGMAGCAGKKGPSDEVLIQQTLDMWAKTLVAKDVDSFMTNFSEKFASSQAADKKTLANFIKEAVQSGYLDDAKVSYENAQRTMKDGKCTVYPVDLSGAAGSVAAELTLAKEEGRWLVVGMEVDGL
jgi:hypothetical protein